jgi:hypothetical protein
MKMGQGQFQNSRYWADSVNDLRNIFTSIDEFWNWFDWK